MKCPHCSVDFHDFAKVIGIGEDVDGAWGVGRVKCSACKRNIYTLICGCVMANSGDGFVDPIEVKLRYLVRPKVSFRPPPPSEVSVGYAEDYLEAKVKKGSELIIGSKLRKPFQADQI
jgi:hypothetical protein